MKLKDIIGSMASKFAAIALALVCAGNVWGADPVTIQDASGNNISVYEVSSGFYQNGTTYTASKDFYITNVNGLKFFRDLVNGDETVCAGYPELPRNRTIHAFSGKFVHLLADIDLDNEPWEPIGYAYQTNERWQFEGSFDGGIYDEEGDLIGAHTISKLNVSIASGKYYAGLFGVYHASANSALKNLVLDGVTISSGQSAQGVGAFVGSAKNAQAGVTLENLRVVGKISITGNTSYVGGIVGDGRCTIRNCSVAAEGTIKGTFNVGGIAGGLLPNSTGMYDCAVTNATVQATAYNYGLGALAGFSRALSVSNCTASAVTVVCNVSSYAGQGLVGLLVGFSDGAPGYTILSDNTVVNTTATEYNTAVTTHIGASNADYTIVGANIAYDGSGKVNGGVFQSIPAAVIADGLTRIPNTDQATSAEYPYTVGIPQVAQIGTTKYETLAEAIAAVPTDGTEATIQMIADSAEAANIVIAATKNVVLDLNGKTVSRTVPGPDAAFITNNGTFTVKDTSASADGAVVLTASSGDYSKQTITVYNIGGTFNLESGTIRNATGTGLAYAVNNAVNWGHVSTFNMTGGTVTAPGGDADLRVYNNTAFSVSADCKNYVNITGGTLASSGLFIDTYLSGTYSANFTGANIANQIAISGGTINGLIDLKLRHAFNTSLSITGGDFTNAKMWVRKYTAEWNSSLAEPTAPYVTISGGKFAFIAGKAFGLAYDCGTSSWTSYEKPYAVSGGVFNVEVPETACAEGYEPAANADAETMAAYPYTVAGAGYGGEVLPAAPVIDGNTITVTPQNIQYTLDGAYGSIDGKTIVLSEGAYPMLYFARATKYAASGTEYYKEQGETRYETIEEIQAHRNEWGTCHYNRTMQNVTLKPADGATVTIAGAECKSGHVYGPNQYDYLLDYGHGPEDEGSMYYLSQTVSNITFNGLTFTGKVNFATSAWGDGYGAWHTTIAGVTFDGCTFTGSGTTDTVGPALRYYSESATGYVSGLTVTDCTFENWYQGVYCNGVKDVTVTESAFDTTGHNAIAVQTQAAANVGEITITGNTFEKIGDRVIRFGNLASGTEITITGNTATDSGDDDDEVIKAVGVAAGIPVTMSNNSWDSGAKSGNPEFGAAGIGNTYYMSIADAIAVANAQNIDEITILDNTSESPDSAWKVADGKLVRKTYVAQIVGGAKFETLAEAIGAAANGDTVQLLKDVDSDARFSITKTLTIDGQGHTIAVNNNDNRVIDISDTSDVTLTLKNVIIDGDNVKVDDAYPRGISMYGNTNVKLVLDNATVSAGHYAINVAGANNGVKIDIKNSSVASGWAAINVWSPAEINVTGSELSGSNDKGFEANGWNNFSTIVLNKQGDTSAAGSELTFTNTKIKSEVQTGNSQWFVDVRCGDATITFDNCEFEQTGMPADDGKHPDAMFAVRGTEVSRVTFTECTFTKDGTSVDQVDALFENTLFYSYPALYSDYIIDGTQYVVGTDGKVLEAFPDTVARDAGYNVTKGTFYAENDPTDTLADGYIADKNADGTYTVRVAHFVAQVNGGAKFESLQAAIDAAQDGDTAALIADVNGLAVVTIPSTKNVILDLNGKTIATAYNGDSSNGRHYYAIDNYGTFKLVDSSEDGTGTIEARGIENYGVMTIEGGTIKSIDANGGAAIWNEAELYINGGTFQTLYAGSSSDTYGPGCLSNRGTATAVITKGNFQSVNNRTYAIVSIGEITINPASDNDVVVSGAHGGLAIDAGTATVNGGSFICTGPYYGCWITNDGNGTSVTINGGVFSGNGNGVYADVDDSAQDASDVAVIINGGYFNTTVKGSRESSKQWTVSLRGGYYQTAPAEVLLAEGFEVVPLTENESDATDVAAYTAGYRWTIGLKTYTVTFEKGDVSDPDFTVAETTFTAATGVEKLPLPTYTAEGKTFAGWKVKDSDPEVILSAIPAGATTNYELVATWKVAKTISVITDDSKPEETTPIKVAEDWIAQNVTNEVGQAITETEQIASALNKTADNGLKVWENYVIGQDPTTAVAVGAEQGETTVMPVSNTLAAQPVDTGFTVEYSLKQVDTNGTEVATVETKATTDFDIDLSTVKSNAYYTMTATIKTATGNEVVSTVTSTNVIGVLAVTNAPATSIVAVPWKGTDGENISVSNLVRTATLTPGDRLQAYDSTSRKYRVWQLSADKTWVPTTVVGGEDATGADACTVSRGEGVWLTRQDPSQPIYLVGDAGAAAAGETKLEAAESTDKPSWNIVASPSVEPVKPAELLKVRNKVGDKIVVLTGGAPKNYYYDEELKAWGYDAMLPVYDGNNNQIGVRPVFKTDDTVPAGTGFWYLNSNTDSGAKITW